MTSIDRAIVSRETLKEFLRKISTNQLKNDSIKGLRFYTDPRIEMIEYLDGEAVKIAKTEEEKLRILKNSLKRSMDANCSFNHSTSIKPSVRVASDQFVILV